MRDRNFRIAAGAAVLAILGVMGCGSAGTPPTVLLVPASVAWRVILPQEFMGASIGMTASSGALTVKAPGTGPAPLDAKGKLILKG